MIRVTSFPILLLIAGYERQAKRTGAITFYDTITAAAEKVLDTLPRSLKRMTLFEGLMAGSDAEIDAVSMFLKTSPSLLILKSFPDFRVGR